jgi:predicted Fe-S protein YdhL (DUF1289 family)
MSEASPCTGVCALDAAQICRGCGRTIEEIAAWPGATPAEREAIRRRAAARRAEAAS